MNNWFVTTNITGEWTIVASNQNHETAKAIRDNVRDIYGDETAAIEQL